MYGTTAQLRTALNAGAAVPDTQLAECLEVATQSVQCLLKPVGVPVPEAVAWFTVQVAVALWRARESGGPQGMDFADVSWPGAGGVTSSLIRKHWVIVNRWVDTTAWVG